MRVTRSRRVAGVVGAVARQALADRGAHRIALIDEATPEARLAAEWLVEALPDGAVVRVSEPDACVEPLLRSAADGARARVEALRFAARRVPDAIVAHPLNRTVLLLGTSAPPDPLLPLGDLFASQIAELCGGWSGTVAVREIADAAGGIDRLDAALEQFLDARRPDALDDLPAPVASAIRAAVRAGAAARRHPVIVPRLAYRTHGVDLFL